MPFAKNVFINCPFDSRYKDDLLKPMLYVIIRNGFTPRLALEISDSAQFRLEKITGILKDCRYCIHDLSKVKSTEAGEYARMNMPFELGIDYGIKSVSEGKLAQKKFLILEATRYDYMRAISDINGLDVKVHKNDTQTLFECLYSWFSETAKVHKQAPPLQQYYDFADFNTRLFREKRKEFKSESIAINYIEKISIAEYIREIREQI
ncbi:MAG: hypothetical protein ACT6QS_16215 [Flavobacteriales bacterium]